MSKCTLRLVATILMYAGAFVFIVPYITSKVSTNLFMLIAGAGLAVVCGLVRSYCTVGDCAEQHIDSKPCP